MANKLTCPTCELPVSKCICDFDDLLKRCRWCGKLIGKINIREHENNCDLNDGGKSDMNYELIEEKYL